MRVVKEADVRREEILNAADRLFGQKGFDGTSIADILDEVGIARGTLYYYFKSKELIMDSLIDRYNQRLMEDARSIADDKSIPVIQRIFRVVTGTNLTGEGSGEIMNHIHKPQNALMHQKIEYMVLRGMTPIITDIILEGIDQGVFHTPWPYEAVEMLIAYSNAVFDHQFELSQEESMKKIKAFLFNAERLFQAEPGSFSIGFDAMSGDK